MPITSVPRRRKELAATAITELAPGAGPPAKTMPTRFSGGAIWIILTTGSAEVPWLAVTGESDIEREIRQRIEEGLARFGVAGGVIVESTRALLHGSGPTVATELGAL